MLDQNAPLFDIPEHLRGEILAEFLRESTELVDQIASQLVDQDVKVINGFAHKLKGSCLTIGANNLAEIARKVEYSQVVQENELKKLIDEHKMLDRYIRSSFL